jgi:TonB family protein
MPAPRRVAAKPAKPATPRAVPSNIQTAAPAEAAPAEADFTMTTMTNANESAFATTGTSHGGGTGEDAVSRPTGGTVKGEQTVALADLSRAPIAPALDAALERNYPAAARDAGVAGTAVVRVRIAASGRAEAVRILSASGDDFGQACRRTLLGSVWQPPLDGHGAAVSTEISYTCRFEVAH